MRFVKPIAILIILGLIGLFTQQNLGIFTAPQTFKLSLYFGQPMVWTLSVFALLTVSAVVGLLVGVLIMLKPYMNLRRKLAQGCQGKAPA